MIKKKHIFIFITIILIGLVLLKYKSTLKKYIEPFYQATPEDLKTVVLEFHYNLNTTCPLTTQFLDGCCKDFDDEISLQLEDDKKYNLIYEIKNENPIGTNGCSNQNLLNDKTYQGTDIVINDSTQDICQETKTLLEGINNKIYKGLKYNKDNPCIPLTYFQDNICIKKSESTYFHLKQILNNINEKFKEDIFEKLMATKNAYVIKKFRAPFGEEEDTTSGNEIYQSYYIPDAQKNTEIPNLKDFRIEPKIVTDTNSINQQEYPFLRLVIPKRYNPKSGEIEYEKLFYDGNINNINSIMEFIYKNVVISFEKKDLENKDDKNYTLSFYKKYYNTEDIQSTEFFKTLYYNDERVFTYSENDNIPEEDKVNLTNNFIRDTFINEFYSPSPSPAPSIPSPPFNIESKPQFKEPKKDIRKETLETDKKNIKSAKYLLNRPLITWYDIPSIKYNKDDIIDLLVLIRDQDLKEYYIDDKTEMDLIYWFAWDVKKNNISIEEMNQDDLNIKKDPFLQLYKYQYFDIEELQYKKTSPLNIVNAKLDIIGITEKQNKKIKEIYNAYGTEDGLESSEINLGTFYKHFFKYLTEQKLLTGINTDNFKLKYEIDPTLNGDIIAFNRSSYNSLNVTLFNYGDCVYKVSQTGEETEIKLPYSDFYELIFIPPINKDKDSFYQEENIVDKIKELDSKFFEYKDIKPKIIINNYEEFEIIDGNYTYLIPYKTNYIKIKLNFPTNDKYDFDVIIRPTQYTSNRVIWNNLVDDEDTYTLELNKTTKFMISYFGTKINEKGNYDTFTNNNFHIIVSKEPVEKALFKFENMPTNSVITFVPDNFDFLEFRKFQMITKYNFSCLRINQVVKPVLSCYAKKPRQQFLPTIKLNVEKGSGNFNLNDLKGALEVYEKNSGRPLYLEWDIDLSSTKLLSYSGIKNRREFITSSTMSNYLDKNVINKNNTDCYQYSEGKNTDVKVNVSNLEKNHTLQTLFKKSGTDLLFYQNKAVTKEGDNFLDIDLEIESGTIIEGFYLKFNKNIGIWQFWFLKDGIHEWIANQDKPEHIFHRDSTWVFSPKYRKGKQSGTYDFFDFPTEFNREKQISGEHKYKFLQVVKLHLSSGLIPNAKIDNCTHNFKNVEIEKQPDSVTINLTGNSNFFNTQKKDNIKFYIGEEVFVKGNTKQIICTILLKNQDRYKLDEILPPGKYEISKIRNDRTYAFANFSNPRNSPFFNIKKIESLQFENNEEVFIDVNGIRKKYKILGKNIQRSSNKIIYKINFPLNPGYYKIYKAHKKLFLKSTLFNVPKVSEDLDTINLGNVNRELGTVNHNIEIVCKLHIYKDITNTNKREELAGELNELVQNNYIFAKTNNSSKRPFFVENIDESNLPSELQNNTDFTNNLKDEIKSQIVIHNAEEHKVPFFKYVSFGNSLPGYQQKNKLSDRVEFNENMKINPALKEKFDEYIENKIYHTDYSSYGDLKLRQSETQFNFITNLDLTCIQPDAIFIKSLDSDVSKKIKIVSIYFEKYYTKNIRDLLENISEKIEKEDIEAIITKLDADLCSKFPKQKIELFNSSYQNIIKDFTLDLKELNDNDDIKNLDYLKSNNSQLKKITDKIANNTLNLDVNLRTSLKMDNKEKINCINPNINISKFIDFSINGENRVSTSAELLDLYTESLKILKLYFLTRELISKIDTDKFKFEKIIKKENKNEKDKDNVKSALEEQDKAFKHLSSLVNTIKEKDLDLLEIIKKNSTKVVKPTTKDEEVQHKMSTKDVVGIYKNMIFSIFND